MSDTAHRTHRYAHLPEARSIRVEDVVAAEFDSMLDGLDELLVYKLRVERDGRRSLVWASPSIEKVIGITRAAVQKDHGVWHAFIADEDHPRIVEAETRALRTGERVRLEVHGAQGGGSDGTEPDERRTFVMTLKPSRLPDDAILWDGTMREVTQDRRSRAERDRLIALVENANDFAGIANADASNAYINEAARRMLKLPAGFDEATLSIDQCHPPHVMERFESEIFPTVMRDGAWNGDIEVQDFEGGTTPVNASIMLHTDASGAPAFFSTIQRDLSERFAMEGELRLVNRELNHRIKNLFSVMQALVAMSARGESDAKVLAGKLKRRMEALSAAHLMSTELEHGRSALRPVPLAELVHSILAPYDREDAHLAIEGATVALPHRMLTPLGLVIHELATNAIKYGAWRDDRGRVAVFWSLEEADPHKVTLHWRETSAEGEGGGEDDAVHLGSGFGSRLMKQSMQQLRGRLAQVWSGGDLHTTLTFLLPAEDEADNERGTQA